MVGDRLLDVALDDSLAQMDGALSVRCFELAVFAHVDQRVVDAGIAVCLHVGDRAFLDAGLGVVDDLEKAFGVLHSQLPLYERAPCYAKGLAIQGLQRTVLKALGRYTDPAWFLAAREGDLATIRTLLDRGVKVDARDEHDDTALTWAANNGHLEVVKALIKAGADVNARQAEGATAMILAADKGNGDIVKALVEAGADVNIKHPDDRLGAIDFAARGGHRDLVHYLQSHGATWR